MKKATQEDLERIGHEAGEAAANEVLSALKDRGVTAKYVAMKLKQLMNWRETKLFQYEGDIIESKKFRSGGIAMKATALVADIYGARAPEKVEHSGVVVLKPDDTIEKK